MAFEFPRVTKCCFCVPLKIASLLIGYLSIAASCLAISAVSFSTYKVAMYVNHNDNYPNPEHTPEEVQKMSLSLYISLGYYMLVFLFNIVIHLMLIIGVHTNKTQYMRYYVNMAYFLLALAITLFVITFVFMGFLATLPALKWTMTIVMCIIVVRSTYLEMEEQSRPKSFQMQNLYMPQQAPLMV